MKAILYMLRKNIKNAIIDTLKSPLKLLVYSFLAASLIFALIKGFTMEVSVDDRLDMRILHGAYLAIFFFISIPIMHKGLSTGSTFFSMSDVNQIFVAPISAKKILVYGIGRQLAASLFLVVSFSAYGSMAIRMFDLTLTQALMLVLGIAAMLLIVQLITLLLFCLCSAHPRLLPFLRLFIYSLPIYALGFVTIYMFTNGLTLEHLFEAISHPALTFTPIVGWMHGTVIGLIEGRFIYALVFLSLLFFFCIISMLVFRVTKLDYYEDVLEKAQSYYEFRDNLRTGRVSDSDWMGSRPVKLRKQGISKGRGGSAIFFKHLREGARRSRFMFFNISTIVLLGVASVMGLAMKNFFSTADNATIIFLSVTVIISYIQFFFSAAGDWVKELNKPYIFLIPDSPVRKLIMAGATSIIKPFIDGALTYTLLWILVGGHIPDVIICSLVYGSFGCIYISSNILAQRIVGISGNRGVFITFYMGFMFLLMIPGVLIGLLALTNISGELSVISASVLGLPVLLWNLLISLATFMLCKNLLNNIE